MTRRRGTPRRPPAPLTTPPSHLGSRRPALGTVRGVIAGLVLGGLVATSLYVLDTHLELTMASWVDVEHVNGAVGSLDCGEPGNFETDGSARFLGANVLGLDLDTVVAATGLHVENDGTAAAATPPTASNVGPDAFATDLDVGLLSSEAPLLGAALDLPLAGQTAGVYRQYA